MKNVLALCSFAIFVFLSEKVSAQTITSQPSSVTVNNASTATFTVGASGATTYQWQFNGGNLSDSATIIGSTNASLTLENVSSNEMGNYTVVINGSVSNNPPAILTVIPGTEVQLTFSGLPNGIGPTVDLQLFDHDKPATVANFIHYIQSGAFTSNMFFQRCATNVGPGGCFALQGGSFGTTDRTNTAPVITGWDIATKFSGVSPSFPPQVFDEFGTGPVIHNIFGSVAMALGSATNSASDGFFFNLTNNTSILDPQYFTVFGQILNGADVLQYFATNGSTVVTNEVFSDQGVLFTNAFTNLPVNLSGTNLPGNANLIYCDFSFLTTPPTDTTPPTLSVTFPTAGVLMTNEGTLTVTGTASDNIALADTSLALTPQLASDGTSPQYAITNYASNPYDWAFAISYYTYYYLGFFPEEAPIPAGVYLATVQSQDGSGNLSAARTFYLTNTAVLINGEGSVQLAQGTNAISSNPIGYPLQGGLSYTFSAVPAAGSTFLNWSVEGYTVTNKAITFSYEGGPVTANFAHTNTPKGTKGFAITYPPANAKITSGTFTVKGKFLGSIKSGDVSIQIVSLSSDLPVTSVLTTSGTGNWSIDVTNLPPDEYLIQAVATNSSGFGSVISEKFSVIAFKPVAGTYSGLFLCENVAVSATNSGFAEFTVTSSGAFSAKLLFPAYRPIEFHDAFFPDGSVGFNLNLPGNPMTVAFQLPVTNDSGILTGEVYSQNSGSWASPLICYRNATKLSADTTPPTGKYILDLNPGGITNGPATNGYAAVTVTGSGVNLSGSLPDGATFTEGTTIGTNGVWPFYVNPTGYKTNGMLFGWMTNTAGTSTGQLFWEKSAGVGKYLLQAVNTNIVVTGTRVSKAASGSSYAIVFDGGSLTAPVTNDLTVNNGGQFVPSRSDDADKLSISLSAAGVLSGHYTSPTEGKALQLKGGFADTNGWGYFLDENSAVGYFTITPQ